MYGFEKWKLNKRPRQPLNNSKFKQKDIQKFLKFLLFYLDHTYNFSLKRVLAIIRTNTRIDLKFLFIRRIGFG